jgi:hypothetical protein
VLSGRPAIVLDGRACQILDALQNSTAAFQDAAALGWLGGAVLLKAIPGIELDRGQPCGDVTVVRAWSHVTDQAEQPEQR